MSNNTYEPSPKTHTTAIMYHIISVDGRYCINETWSNEVGLTKLDVDRIQYLHSYFKDFEKVKYIVEKINAGRTGFDYNDEEYFIKDNRNQNLVSWEKTYDDIPKFKIIKTVRKSIITETVEEITV